MYLYIYLIGKANTQTFADTNTFLLLVLGIITGAIEFPANI